MKPLYMLFKKLNFFTLLITATLVVTSSSALAVKHYVTNTSDSSPGSLRDLITNSNAGDTIVIDVSGTLVLQSGITMSNSVVIIGPAPIHFKIDASLINGAFESSFNFSGSANYEFSGVGFENSTNATHFGTNSGYSGTLTIKQCSFLNNGNTAINVDGGSIVVDGCSFENNVSANEAGVCLFTGTQAKFINCTFFNNDASFEGGALHLSGGNVDIIHCTFFENGSTPAAGKAIFVNGSQVSLRNNIIFNDSQTNALIDISAGTLNSLGGNITNDEITTGSWVGSDMQSISVNSGLSIGSKVRDGWGITYFPPAAGSDGIDIDAASTNLPLMDQRRVWRVMDGGSGNAYADAGAVEFSRFTVTQPGTGNGSLFSAWHKYDTLAYAGKAAIVFELSGTGPFAVGAGFSSLNFYKDSTIINGFSQDSSKIPGPGNVSGTITSGYTPIRVNNPFGSSSSAIEITSEGNIIAGLSIGGFTTWNTAAIVVTGADNTISGCHLGVNSTANSNTPNTHGVAVVGSSAAAKIGSGKYCGENHHANRNVISGNQSSQVRIASSAQMKISNNIIGLDGVGLDKPTGAAVSNDTGVVTGLYAYTQGSGVTIGDQDIHNRNIIGDQSIGVMIASNSNKVFNNFIGTDYTGNNVGATTPNDYGIEIADPMGTYLVEGNWIGETDRGNVVAGNVNEGIVVYDVFNNNVFANRVGVGLDGMTALGNGGAGIYVGGFNAFDNRIGAPGKGNVIGDNDNGIVLSDDSQHSIVRSNLIGVASDTTSALGNSGDGILVETYSNSNFIGGCYSGEGNYIGNNNNGLVFEYLGADYDTIMGNHIGYTLNGNDIGNIEYGIYFVGDVQQIVVGDVAAGCGNEIAFNDQGIVTDYAYSGSLTFSGNSIHDNAGLGIDLDEDSTPDYTTDDGLQSNNAAPIGQVSQAASCSGNLNIILTPETTGSVTYEIFKADASGAEGDSLIYQFTASVQYYVDTLLELPVSVPSGTNLVMTATQPDGSTSEFGLPFTVASTGAALTPSISHTEVCFGGNTYPELTVPSSVGTAVWFWDAGLTQRIEAGDTISAPEDDLFINGPGTFNYYVVDSVAGCYGTVSSPVTLDIIPSPTYPINAPDTLCTDNAYQFSTTRPASFNSLTWSFVGSAGSPSVQNGINFFNPLPGSEELFDVNTYGSWDGGVADTLELYIDSAGCVSIMTKPIAVVYSSQPDGDSISHPTTCGGVDGYIGLGGLPSGVDLTLFYDGGAGTTITVDANGFLFLTGLSAGTYAMDSIDNGNCVVDLYGQTFTLTDPTPQTVYAGPDQTDCEGSTITLSASPAGGSGSFTYSWDNGGGSGQTVNVTPVASTEYIVTCTDDITLCEARDTVMVTVNPLPLTDAGPDMAVCIDNGNITLSGSPSGGTWTGTGVSGSDFDPISAGTGTHVLTYTYIDGNGCTALDDMDMTVNANPQPGNPLSTDALCFGSFDGSVMLMPIGGPYDYSWTGPNGFTATTQNISSLEAGTYNVVVTDPGTGCTSTASGFVNEPSAIVYTTNVSNASCPGLADGSIEFTVSGGSPTYQYSIDAGANYSTSFSTTATESGLLAGTYNCVIQDANGCLSNSMEVVSEPADLGFTVNQVYNDTCGQSVGAVLCNTSPPNGSPPFSYEQVGTGIPQATPYFGGLSAGTYEFMVADNGFCTDTVSVTVNDEAGVSISFDGSTDVSCFGLADGSAMIATVDPLGGGVSYDWILGGSSVATTEDLSGAVAGSYEVMATDMGGCQDSVTVVINEPALLSVLTDIIDETCSGYGDGILDTISVSGGTPNYLLDWVQVGGSSVGTTAPLTGLSAGDYVGVITDANGCEARDTVTVNAGETYTAAISATYLDSCINNNSYDFVDGNGVPPSGASSFSWGFANGSPSMSVAQNPTGIEFTWPNSNLGVNYEVTSYAGCIFRDTIYIWIYDTADVSLVPTDVTCFGGTDGAIVANATGGTGPYTYSFNGNTPTASNTITGLGSGNYSCYVVDTYSGCQTSTLSVSVTQPNEILFNATVTDATCGEDNGMVDFQNVTGGTGGYSYSVDGSNYVSTNPITDLTPGSYTFYVQDGNGCVEVQNSNTIGNVGSPVPQPSIQEGDNYLVCMDGSGSYGELTVVSNDVTAGTFEWSMVTLGNVISANDTLELDDFNTGNHYIFVVESNGSCESPADTVLLDVTESDIMNNTLTEVCVGSEVALDVSTSGDLYWYNANGEIADTTSGFTTALPTALPVTYNFDVLIGDCIFKDSVELVEDPDCDGITISNNAFSPNGDGVNDLFRIDVNALIGNENTVTIVNRWGDVIRTYSNYDNVEVAWDGTNSSGDAVPSGTYFFIIEIPSLELKTTGWIQVVR